VAIYEDQVADYECQLTELKLGLETLQGELERCQSVSRTSRATVQATAENNSTLEDVTLERDRLETDLKRLKAKCKVLLAQYGHKKELVRTQSKKMRLARQALLDVKTVCAATERNYEDILCHLGSEVEICARLMSAYLDVRVTHDQPVRLRGRSLLAWFCDVQAMSTWLQRQLVAFGKRVWTEREPCSKELKKKVLPFPQIPAVTATSMANAEAVDNTLSEVSQSIEEDRSQSIREAVRLQDQMVRSRDVTIEKVLSDL
jgi:hypothetical protein